MHKNGIVSKFEQRLLQLGCPRAQSRRSAGEIADHYEDLKAGALEEGMTEAQAQAQAAERLGDPRALAEGLAAALRNGTWWGRHPVIGFCLLPSAGILFLLVFVPILILQTMQDCLPESQWEILANGGSGNSALSAIIQIAFYGSFLALIIFFLRLAQRNVLPMKWRLTALFICSLHAAFTGVWVRPHNLIVGYMTQFNWHCAALPLATLVVVVAWQRRAIRNAAVALLMAALFLAPSARADEKPPLQRGWIGGEYKVDRPWCIRQRFFPPPEILYDASFPKSVRISQNAAIKITELGTNTPTTLSGLLKGDLILEVDHRRVTRLSEFWRNIDESEPGTSILLTVFRGGETLDFKVPVGRQTFRPGGNFTVGLLPFVHDWRLIPDVGLSVVFAGWEPRRGLRHDLGSNHDILDQSWKAWLGIFEINYGNRVIAETNVPVWHAMPKAAMAGL